MLHNQRFQTILLYVILAANIITLCGQLITIAYRLNNGKHCPDGRNNRGNDKNHSVPSLAKPFDTLKSDTCCHKISDTVKVSAVFNKTVLLNPPHKVMNDRIFSQFNRIVEIINDRNSFTISQFPENLNSIVTGFNNPFRSIHTAYVFKV